MECPYCGGTASLRDSSVIYGKSYGNAWICENFPRCDSYVGCHKNTTRPLGELADGDTRKARQAAHRAFDTLWKAGLIHRGRAYAELTKALDSKRVIHIGGSNIATCRLIEAWSYRVKGELIAQKRIDDQHPDMVESRKRATIRETDAHKRKKQWMAEIRLKYFQDFGNAKEFKGNKDEWQAPCQICGGWMKWHDPDTCHKRADGLQGGEDAENLLVAHGHRMGPINCHTWADSDIGRTLVMEHSKVSVKTGGTIEWNEIQKRELAEWLEKAAWTKFRCAPSLPSTSGTAESV